ncbi:MAG: DUF5723 family protein, partial [Prevotellaceae bacterium]|nr:DUF5723 family protein [Prevotellaceae bacterium]
MNKKQCLILLLATALSGAVEMKAQNFAGYDSHNYRAAGGMIFNPASIADSRYKLNVNILSFSVGLDNTAYSIRTASVFSGFDDWKEGKDYSKVQGSGTKDIHVNADVLGPSFMLDLGKKIGSIGLSTRVRVMLDEVGISNEIFQLIGGYETYDYFGKGIAVDKMSLGVHAFADMGLTYARTVWEDSQHKVKAGVTGKYLSGFAGGSLHIDDLKMKINQDPDLNNIENEDIFESMRGKVALVYSDGIDKLIDDGDPMDLLNNMKGSSFGLDLGFEYEWNPSWRRDSLHRTPYLLKASASITDIGSVGYTASKNSGHFALNADNFKVSDLDAPPEGDTFEAYVDYLKREGILTESEAVRKYRIKLPTALRLNVDWNAWRNVFVNVGTVVNLVSKGSFSAKYASLFYITPRYERKFITAYSPISFGAGNFNWGVGVSAGV